MTEDTVRTTWPGTESFNNYDFFAQGVGIVARTDAANLLLVVSVQKRNGLAPE